MLDYWVSPASVTANIPISSLVACGNGFNRYCLGLQPKLLIADEPTTALDVTIQAQVLELMKKLQEEFKTAMLLITHDLGVVAEICDDVLLCMPARVMSSED